MAKSLANKVYFIPISPEYVEQLIRSEGPDDILLRFGDQIVLKNGGFQRAVAPAGVMERNLFCYTLTILNLIEDKLMAVYNYMFILNTFLANEVVKPATVKHSFETQFPERFSQLNKDLFYDFLLPCFS